jgi:hypothetical protein
MKPTKGKLFVLLAIIGAIGLVTATGAFGSVTAQRVADVSVSGDDAALLGLQAGSGFGSSYVTGTDEISIDLTNVNTNSTSEFPNAINITNRGSDDVAVNISATGANTDAIAFAVEQSELDDSPGTPSADLNWPETQAYRIDGGGKPIDLQPGESIQVSFYIDTADGDVSNGLTPSSSGTIGADTEIISSVDITASASNAEGDSDSTTGNYEAA